ncbi:hypothetical protein VIOR3934_20911 [Vibrio orientalis CIP 102891 = ATCC 33934]|uniref:N-acetyltransferase domain-containing protein n=2 Tax=Vibrio orientalis CIP 102891 = ATCC 33934 TaxID=675816 RepID=F9SRE9_VIBOR|nr:GNAT family N-acetyltransferase [Vibrio orientalis]EGU51373.1 hypothetical protein VIOR3934_20911 [Vibrio orientalis CIP 102891 = ATCC 33934]
MPHSLIFDEVNSQFRVHLDADHYAVIKFVDKGSTYAITSTKIPEELQGKGYGKVMMEVLLSEIAKRGVTIDPICPYVAHYLERNQQWSYLKAQ